MPRAPALSAAERAALWRARQRAAQPIDLDDLAALVELLDSPAVAGNLFERFGGLAKILEADPEAIVAAMPREVDPVSLDILARKLAALRLVWHSAKEADNHGR